MHVNNISIKLEKILAVILLKIMKNTFTKMTTKISIFVICKNNTDPWYQDVLCERQYESVNIQNKICFDQRLITGLIKMSPS